MIEAPQLTLERKQIILKTTVLLPDFH